MALSRQPITGIAEGISPFRRTRDVLFSDFFFFVFLDGNRTTKRVAREAPDRRDRRDRPAPAWSAPKATRASRRAAPRAPKANPDDPVRPECPDSTAGRGRPVRPDRRSRDRPDPLDLPDPHRHRRARVPNTLVGFCCMKLTLDVNAAAVVSLFDRITLAKLVDAIEKKTNQ